MSTISANFELIDDPTKDLRELLGKLANPAPADMDPIADEVRAGIAENFAGERSGDGVAWRVLAKSTIRDRRRKGYPGDRPKLVRSGRLRNLVTDKNDADHIQRVTADADGWSLEVGGNRPIVEWHDSGTDDGHIPERPFLDMSERASSAIESAVDRWFDRIIDG